MPTGDRGAEGVGGIRRAVGRETVHLRCPGWFILYGPPTAQVTFERMFS